MSSDRFQMTNPEEADGVLERFGHDVDFDWPSNHRRGRRGPRGDRHRHLDVLQMTAPAPPARGARMRLMCRAVIFALVVAAWVVLATVHISRGDWPSLRSSNPFVTVRPESR